MADSVTTIATHDTVLVEKIDCEVHLMKDGRIVEFAPFQSQGFLARTLLPFQQRMRRAGFQDSGKPARLIRC